MRGQGIHCWISHELCGKTVAAATPKPAQAHAIPQSGYTRFLKTVTTTSTAQYSSTQVCQSCMRPVDGIKRTQRLNTQLLRPMTNIVVFRATFGISVESLSEGGKGDSWRGISIKCLWLRSTSWRAIPQSKHEYYLFDSAYKYIKITLRSIYT